MKFELKTNNEEISKPLLSIFLFFTGSLILILFSSMAMNLGKISRHYEINLLCRLLIVDKSSNNFKKLSKLSNQTSKQKVWDLCKEIIK